MNAFSLRTRLLVAAGIVIILALTGIAASLSWIFERHLLRQYQVTAVGHLNQLISGTTLQRDGSISLDSVLAGPEFHKPLSGYYWQVEGPQADLLLRSRSLWDSKLSLPKSSHTSPEVVPFKLTGPNGKSLLAWERRILLTSPGEEKLTAAVRFVVAMNSDIIDQARNDFLLDVVPALLAISIILMLASWFQVRIGLAPLDRIRRGLSAVRSGKRQQLEGSYPLEVMPLVDETNRLLHKQVEAIKHAKNWTGDLAHGLKTPLTVLAADADRLAAEGQTEIAGEMHRLILGMQRRIDRELIRARIGNAGLQSHQRCDPVRVLSGIARALQRTPGGEKLNWQLALPEQGMSCVSINSDNLSELLGNLLENANHWAHSGIRITLRDQGEQVWICIEDDGPGVDQAELQQLGQRGVRLDESIPGTGLGLAIAMDIVAAYSGTLDFSLSKLGGLKVEIRLPACD